MSSIKEKIKKLPKAPGVYFFLGEKGEILYIGKATNLRSRVQSYFRDIISSEAEKSNAKKDSDLSTSLRFAQDDKDMIFAVQGRSEWIGRMVSQVEDIAFEQTDSVLEALILESNLIKERQPKYNTLEKDDKSFAYFVITKEEFPRVLILRKTDIDKKYSLDSMSLRGGTPPKQSRVLLSSGSPRIFEYKNSRDDGNKTHNPKPITQNLKIETDDLKIGKPGYGLRAMGYGKIYGPYTSKQQMQIALKIIRRIFPFHALNQKNEKGCLDFQLGTCPGPYANAISKEDYKKNINGIKMILEGKKKRLVSNLEKEMKALAKKNEFEKAAEVRNKIFALRHIRDVALITRDMEHGTWNMMQEIQETGDNNQKNSKFEIQNSKLFRIEAYDISNISGTDAVGSMVVFSNGKPDKSQYRKFKIKTVEGSNDVAMMKEVLLRRFKNDWAMPDLILLDGGAGHVNMATYLLHEQLGLDVAIVGVAKGPTRKKLDYRFSNPEKTQDTRYKIQDIAKIDSEDYDMDINQILQDKLLVKAVMDEAHRFAITFHRKLRGKKALQ